MANFRMAPQALKDLQEALAWYEARSARAAGRFCSAVDDALDEISLHPTRFARWEDPFRYYKLPGFPYNVLYHYDGVVTIASIRHTSRGDTPIEKP